jgi:hypothetical protein
MGEDDTETDVESPAVTEWDGGWSWISYPAERGRRASHALETDAGVWLVDPVDHDGLDDVLATSGDVTAVLVLHDRHTRDAETVARRHNVGVHVPSWMELVRTKLDEEPAVVDDTIPGTNYAVEELVDTDEWEEAFLVDQSSSIMLVPEAVGTLRSFGSDDENLGVHPSLDDPPRRLADWHPDRLLVGHGKSIYTDAHRQLEAALDSE